MLPFKICLRHPSGTSFLTGASLPKKVLDSPPPPPPPKDPTSQRFGTESCADEKWKMKHDHDKKLKPLVSIQKIFR